MYSKSRRDFSRRRLVKDSVHSPVEEGHDLTTVAGHIGGEGIGVAIAGGNAAFCCPDHGFIEERINNVIIAAS